MRTKGSFHESSIADRRHRRRADNGEASRKNIVIPFDRGTLASHIGTTRENLSRSLALLMDHGVRARGREIVIDNKDQLEAFAHPQRLIDDPTS